MAYTVNQADIVTAQQQQTNVVYNPTQSVVSRYVVTSRIPVITRQ